MNRHKGFYILGLNAVQSGLDGVAFQKREFFIARAVRISNPR
jgi:hypothetical protein